MPELKEPIRNINSEYLLGLEVLSNKEFALPGARCRGGATDARFTHLASGTAEATLFTHLVTVRHKSSGMLFVAFKKTLDALHLEQNDSSIYPKWLMDSDIKKTELDIYIHSILPPYNKNPSLVLHEPSIMDVTGQTRIHKWLQEITTPWVFDTVVYYLLQNNIITPAMYKKMC